MISEFRLTGLNRLGSKMVANCEILGEEGNWFKARVYGDDTHKDSLWKYCKNEWKEKKIAIVEHEGFSSSGMPVNPVMLYFRIAETGELK